MSSGDFAGIYCRLNQIDDVNCPSRSSGLGAWVGEHGFKRGCASDLHDAILSLGQTFSSIDAVEHPIRSNDVRLDLELRGQELMRLRAAELLRS